MTPWFSTDSRKCTKASSKGSKSVSKPSMPARRASVSTSSLVLVFEIRGRDLGVAELGVDDDLLADLVPSHRLIRELQNNSALVSAAENRTRIGVDGPRVWSCVNTETRSASARSVLLPLSKHQMGQLPEPSGPQTVYQSTLRVVRRIDGGRQHTPQRSRTVAPCSAS